MIFFEEAALRLKQQLHVTEDQQVAEFFDMTGKAWTARKRRNAFPEKELRALAQRRPELGLDVDYVLTGGTPPPVLEQTRLVTVSIEGPDGSKSYKFCMPIEEEKIQLARTAAAREEISERLSLCSEYTVRMIGEILWFISEAQRRDNQPT